MSVEKISLSRTPAYCGYAFDFAQPGADQQDPEQVSQHMRDSLRSSGRDSLRPSEVPSPVHHAQQVNRLRELCQPYYDLSQFVRLISLFQQWREEEQKLIECVYGLFHGSQTAARNVTTYNKKTS